MPDPAPDLVAAGGAADTQEAPSLVDALRSQGSLPAGLGALLMPPPNPAQVLGSALAGGVAFMRGQPNPVLAQQELARREQAQQAQIAMGIMQGRQQAQRDLRRDQMDLMRLALAQKAETRAERKEQDTVLQQMEGWLIDSGNPEARKAGWATRAARMKREGIDLPPDVIESLSAGTLDREDLYKAALDKFNGMSDAEILGVHKKLRPEQMGLVDSLSKSDAVLKQVTGKTQEDWAMAREDHAIKLQSARNQERKLDIQEQQMAIREERAIRAERRADERLDLAERNARRADDRFDLWRKELDRKFETKDDKKKATQAVMEEWLDQLTSTGAALDKSSYLPKGPGILAEGQASVNRRLWPNDPNLRLWSSILQGGGVGFERAILNDIGPRALAAYKGVLGFFDHPPTKEGIDKAVTFMRKEIEIAKAGKRSATQDIVYSAGGKRFRVERWTPGDPLPPDATIEMVDGQKVAP